ncbi:hypothetical protein HYV10_00755 [Candidatus Dependentiae bacterium]|nr:hypothetical protein [Candidatus Dependentiae bacterium]
MKIDLSILTKSIYGIIFLGICLWGSISTPNILGVKALEVPLAHKLLLSFIENDTPGCEFQTFYASQGSSSFVFPQSTFYFKSEALDLSTGDTLVIKCSKGSFFPVFIKYCGIASGNAPENFEGPYYITMWLSNPQVPETSKVHVRYVRKKGVNGKIGIKIGSKGDYRFVADQNIQFLS